MWPWRTQQGPLPTLRQCCATGQGLDCEAHGMPETRIEKDSLGEIEVPADALWGAQTERSRRFFKIGGERMPTPVIRALGMQKKAAAQANMRLGVLEHKLGEAIVAAADEVIAGK